jgi:hypothetical protein
MAEINTGRQLLSFPHCGRVFVCQDVLGISDMRMATDAYQYVLENGIPFVNAVASAMNWGNKYTVGNLSDTLVTMPVVGIEGHPAGGFGVNVGDPFFSTEAVGEIRPDCDGYSLDLCWRMMTQAEYADFGFSSAQNPSGIGYRGQRITVTIQNQAVAAASSTYVLVDIFANYNWYSANVATLPPLATAVNTIDLETNPQGFALGAINNATIIGTLPASILRGFICQASCYFRYEMPKNENGVSWSNTAQTDGFGTLQVMPHFLPVVNPLLGPSDDTFDVRMGGVGILSTGLSTFWTGLGTIPTGAVGTGGTRVVTTFANQAAQPLLAMGGTVDALQIGNLRLRARSAIGAAWPAISIMARNFGGVLKPICGNGGVYTESDAAANTMTTYIQVPHGAANFVLIARVRTINANASTHTVDFLLTNSDGNASQTLATTTQAGNSTGYRYLYVNAALNTNMRPVSELVERYELRLRSTKSNPRNTQIVEPSLADGILAVYIAFYQ